MSETRPAARRRGRRPAGEDTRSALLAAARVEFAERGFDGATVRRIADRAGVDAAMVNHWFGGKERLFTASLDLPMDPDAILAEVLPGDPEQLGERIIAMFLRVWDATGGGPLAALIRSVAGHEQAARMMREFVARVILGRFIREVAPDRPDLRAALCATQIIGLGMIRYVLRLEPLASADHQTVVTTIAPSLQRYLTGELG
ncbi:TetR/AcrR family transcriptional regulator [Pseudonocardia bannensis]|uniref:TetR/AcrR family transcriptional regulator n=1 Tax=Pseudonocardia bannensis TaxID=630973 RepID=A0A848DJR7_9PSEU|nr:TetR family transcriptional regulator [Pseudonocardia bannensis]NMH92793.1 TetR/AcrR family transcriptional regulator [Pseudonocardia bannensis]